MDVFFFLEDLVFDVRIGSTSRKPLYLSGLVKAWASIDSRAVLVADIPTHTSKEDLLQVEE